jgi:hypothetical protein
MSAKAKNKTKAGGNPDVVSFETFRTIGNFEAAQLQEKEPSAFNSIVNIRKYRVTIELVDEPMQVLIDRLQKLWDECDNYHNWTPLKDVAKTLKYELIGSPGSKKPKN